MVTILISLTLILHLQGQSTDTVPAVLLSLANRAPLDFVTMLATAQVPAGVELKERDDVYPAGHPEVTPATQFDLDTRAPAQSLVEAFNVSHSEYKASWMDGVFVVRPTEDRVEFLDQQSSLNESIVVTGVMNAGRRVLCQLESALCSAVVLGSQIGGLETAGFFAQVTLTANGTSRVIDTLNQIVRQSPRTWSVVTRRDQTTSRIIRYGFIHAYGQRTIQSLSSK